MDQETTAITVKVIGKHPATGYPEVECPGCKRHFFWSNKDKEFFCSCGTTILVEKED